MCAVFFVMVAAGAGAVVWAEVASGAGLAGSATAGSTVTGSLWIVGAGALTVGAGSLVVGWTSCDQAGVEESARAAAIAGRALDCACILVFHIMKKQPRSRCFGCAIIGDAGLRSGESNTV
jgi:hypothetical protein